VKEGFKRVREWITDGDCLLYLIASICLNRVTDWLSRDTIQPFIFYTVTNRYGEPTGITWQQYFFYLTGHITIILFWNVLMKKVISMSQLFFFYRAVEIVALFDFFLIYEKPFLYIGQYGVEFTDIRVLTYITLYILWKAGK